MRALIAIALMVSGIASAGVPEACRQYQRQITAEARELFGLNAPISVLAAQIQQESACRVDALSYVGASGLAQFMPATAKDMARIYPTELGPADPTNPRWALKAQARYMRDLTRAAQGKTECDTWAFGLASYNGGLGWLRRDQRICRAKPACDASTWFGNVEKYSTRSAGAFKENRGYPKRIILILAPRYEAAGYGRNVVCTQ